MSPLRPLIIAALVGAPGASLSAQTDVTLELGASQIGSAPTVDTKDARFAIAGLRASHYTLSGSGVYASLLGGQVVGDSTGGSFLTALVEGKLRAPWTPSWSGSVDARLLAFGVKDPFPYRTLAMELATSVRYRTPTASVEVELMGGAGRSRLEVFRRPGGLSRVFEADLWRVGTSTELLVGSPSVQVGVAGSAHRTTGEAYGSLGGRLVLGGDWGVVELRADRWDTPLGYETTGGLSLALPLGGGWSVRGFFGRSDPDPLTLAQPGSGAGGVLFGRSLHSSAREAATEAPFEVLSYTETGSRIRLSVEAPAGATEVELMGDFNLWEPMPMRRAGDRWVVELDVPEGTHHYGFLVDDEWYVPDDSPDVVPDEWGRLSATLVIEGAGS